MLRTGPSLNFPKKGLGGERGASMHREVHHTKASKGPYGPGWQERREDRNLRMLSRQLPLIRGGQGKRESPVYRTGHFYFEGQGEHHFSNFS